MLGLAAAGDGHRALRDELRTELLAHSPLLAFSTHVSRLRPNRVSISLTDAPGPHAAAPTRELYEALVRD
ncbi:hypothetical protein AWU68_0994 [Corynebacterium simulans]|nr:hypothetical protein AWU68_0994 [Corynebacterium simulans]